MDSKFKPFSQHIKLTCGGRYNLERMNLKIRQKDKVGS